MFLDIVSVMKKQCAFLTPQKRGCMTIRHAKKVITGAEK